MPNLILVAEDDSATRQAWQEIITSWGYKVLSAEDGRRALELIQLQEPEIVIADLRMPQMDGLTLLREIRKRGLDTAFIMVSGEGEIPDAVAAIKEGAYDYLRKPADPVQMKTLLANLSDHLDARAENALLRRRLAGEGMLGGLLGKAASMRQVMTTIEQVAPSTASVIITGESGTGKEVAARTIHELSPRRRAPYVAVNCAAIPDSLMESELFGHERGAFTGADQRRKGCFELAQGGTLLLDELAEMKIELQAKLLRVIEEQKLRRLGGDSEVNLDVRVLAASNRSPERAIRDGQLREDLYYRLAVFGIEMPPLRERVEDIPLLAEHFVRHFAEKSEKVMRGADSECLNALRSYSWPGNVRQLRNIVERAVIVSRGPLLTTADLPPQLRRPSGGQANFNVQLGSSLDDVERELILRTIEYAQGNKSRAAEILGVSLKTLYNRLERYDDKRRPAQSDP